MACLSGQSRPNRCPEGRITREEIGNHMRKLFLLPQLGLRCPRAELPTLKPSASSRFWPMTREHRRDRRCNRSGQGGRVGRQGHRHAGERGQSQCCDEHLRRGARRCHIRSGLRQQLVRFGARRGAPGAYPCCDLGRRARARHRGDHQWPAGRRRLRQIPAQQSRRQRRHPGSDLPPRQALHRPGSRLRGRGEGQVRYPCHL